MIMKLRVNNSDLMPVEKAVALFVTDDRNVIRNAGYYPLAWFENDDQLGRQFIVHESASDRYRSVLTRQFHCHN